MGMHLPAQFRRFGNWAHDGVSGFCGMVTGTYRPKGR